MSPSPAEFMSAAPTSPNGSSPWAARYAGEIRRTWQEFAAEDARSLQKHLGPSELGVACDRQVVGKLAGLPATNHVSDPWPSLRGRALHTMAEDVFNSDNKCRGMRWVTEQKVSPGLAEFLYRFLAEFMEHPGTADLYDAVEQCCGDHKFLGTTSMEKIRKGWPRKYKVQLLLYGCGWLAMGLPVKRVAVIAYPATAASLDGLYVRDLDFTSDGRTLLPEVLELLETVARETAQRKQMAAALLDQRIRIGDVPAAPDDSECIWCEQFRPQAAQDNGPGCPGPRQGPHGLVTTHA